MLKIVTASAFALVSAGLVLAFPVVAAAPKPAAPAATPAAPATVAPDKVLSAVSGAWTDSGGMDRAVLINDEDNTSADLIIYVANGPDPSQGVKVASFAHDIAFAGAMFGNMPELRTAKTGALQIYSENMAVGRDKWERTMTLSYRKGQFVISGLTLSAFDTLDPKAGGSCDINFLTGAGKAGKTKIKLAAGGIPVDKWTEDMIPAACQF